MSRRANERGLILTKRKRRIYQKQKQLASCHFGDDDIVIGSFRFNPVHQIENFEHQNEFDFYVDTGAVIYLCYFTVHAKLEIEKHVNQSSPVESLVFNKERELELEAQLKKAANLIQALEQNNK